MKKLFFLLLCAAFVMVGCEDLTLDDTQNPDNTEAPDNTDTPDTPEDPVFVVNADGDYVVAVNGGTVEVVVATNIDYTVCIPYDAQSWVTHAETRSIRYETLVFNIAKNSLAQARTAKVDLIDKGGNVLESLVFVQNAAVVEDASEIVLSANKTQAEVGDVIIFTVMEKSGKNVTASSTIRNQYDYSVVENAKYKTTKEGKLNFFATRNGLTSNIVTVTVGNGGDEPEQTEGAFLHKVLLVDHTGMNCGNCPAAMDHLRVVANTDWHNYYNEVQCHAGSYASGDPGRSEAATALNFFMGSYINGYPSITVNFSRRASSYTSSNIITALGYAVNKSGADVGISLSVERGASKVICNAQIKAAVSNEYKVNAWLLENNIYSPNQSGASKDYHYYYNHVLRKTSETFTSGDCTGKSVGMIYFGETYNYNCEIAVDSSWEMNNLEVLIVVTARDGNGNWDVVNTALCAIDQTTPFAYVQ